MISVGFLLTVTVMLVELKEIVLPLPILTVIIAVPSSPAIITP